MELGVLQMKRCFAVVCSLLWLAASSTAQNITTLDKIGHVARFSLTPNAVALTCRDDSQVQLTVLAADLIRVRASFGKSIPSRDHSWAIEKTDWSSARWSFLSTDDSLSIKTDEFEVLVRRDPLLIGFRDVRTGRVINADEQPMVSDGKGQLKGMMFDPDAGRFVAERSWVSMNITMAWEKKRRDWTSCVAPSLTGTQTPRLHRS
jgi:Domain of unknown function (DUF4968)